MSARIDIWSFVQRNHPSLIPIAKSLAQGTTTPQPPLKSPALNFLVNGEPPTAHPLGLGGFVKAATQKGMELAKGSNAEGFQAATAVGLGILFGTWSDYCLNCWARWSSDYEEAEPCRLVLARDHGPLKDILLPGIPGSTLLHRGSDWGEQDLSNFYASKDRSTLRLFNALRGLGTAHSAGSVFVPNQTNGQLELERIIARKRIFVFNVWPWFRSGTQSCGVTNMHPDLSKVQEVKNTLAQLICSLNPHKIACLGAWSYDYSLQTPEAWMCSRMLTLTPLKAKPKVDVFWHPSARTWGRPWRLKSCWNGGMRWGGITNEQAFINFLK